jgi:hypothetical protein
MKQILMVIALAGVASQVPAAHSEVLGVPSDLYTSAKQLLGTKEKVLVGKESKQMMVWKSGDGVVVVPITGLRNNPQEQIYSFTGYALTSQGDATTKVYQCSWREVQRKAVYECGEGMKLPEGLREMPPQRLFQDVTQFTSADGDSAPVKE